MIGRNARIGMTAMALLAQLACAHGGDDQPGGTTDDTVDTTPLGCPHAWVAPALGTPGADQILVEEGTLRLEAGTSGITTHALMGSTPTPGAYNEFVIRAVIRRISLGAGGTFVVAFPADGTDVARMEISATGAHLEMTPLLHGASADLAFVTMPTQAIVELESDDEANLIVRATFFDAAPGEFLQAGAPAYQGGQVGGAFEVHGISSSVQVESFAFLPWRGLGQVDDFECDSLSRDGNTSIRFPEDEVSSGGATCTDDAACGPSEGCGTDGVCRRVCLTSAMCGGQVCLADGTGRGLCRLSAETACDPPCGDGLTCGPDATCRTACMGGFPDDVRGSCALPQMLCVGGACVDNYQLGATGSWGGCVYGAKQCQGDQIVACNVGGPGMQVVTQCAFGACAPLYEDDDGVFYNVAPEDGNTFGCIGCSLSCGADGNVYQGGCGFGQPTLLETCAPLQSSCGFGNGPFPRVDAYCQPIVAATTPAPPAAIDAGGPHPFRMDATEVRRSDYVAYLQAHVGVTAPHACDGHIYQLPDAWPWFDEPDRPALVGWCEAAHYCLAVGGRLCDGLDGGELTYADFGNPQADEWAYACTSGGARAFAYGDAYDTTACDGSGDATLAVGSHPACTSDVAGFTDVYDLSGGMREWSGACSAGADVGTLTDSCALHAGPGAYTCAQTDGPAERGGTYTAGIRCCYDAAP